MSKILEAMGILALVTRHTPADIAEEWERIQEMLDLLDDSKAFGEECRIAVVEVDSWCNVSNLPNATGINTGNMRDDISTKQLQMYTL
jgi:hypothetical protein